MSQPTADLPTIRRSAPGRPTADAPTPTTVRMPTADARPTATSPTPDARPGRRRPTDVVGSTVGRLARSASAALARRQSARDTRRAARAVASRPQPPSPTTAPTASAVGSSTAEPTQSRRRIPYPTSRAGRLALGAVVGVIGVALAVVVCAPIALSSQDIIDWARSVSGLGLEGHWPYVVFFALDAAAAVCVGFVVFCAWRGESAGIFGLLIWVFALTSAYANHQYNLRPGAPGDAKWFFPAMAVLGPFLLEVVVRKIRKWIQEGTGKRSRHGVSFGLGRWIPGVGATRETYGAWRLARLVGIDDADEAIDAYRKLCPTGSVQVLRALQEQERLYGKPTTRPTTGTRPAAPQPTPRPTSQPTATPTPPAARPTAEPNEKPTTDRRPLRSTDDTDVLALLFQTFGDQPDYPDRSPSLGQIRKTVGGSQTRAIRLREVLKADHYNQELTA